MEHRFVVSPAEAGERLDRCLARRLGISRRQAMQAIAMGGVRVNGRRAAKGHLLQEGEEVAARVALDLRPVPEPRPLTIRYEDDDLLVVDKPAGWPTHPLEAGETRTLANAVVAHVPACAEASADPREGGATHRLDTETSGLVLFAKSRPVWEALRGQFTARTVHKEYLALARGAVRAQEIRLPIARPVRGRARTARPGEEGREAHTRVEIVEEIRPPGQGVWTLVRCIIPTGVMHQIRVHLHAIGHPLAGDPLYGDARFEGLDRLFLHASALEFDHPVTGRRMRVASPLPDALAALA